MVPPVAAVMGERQKILTQMDHFQAELAECLRLCVGEYSQREHWGFLRWEMDIRLMLWSLEDELALLD